MRHQLGFLAVAAILTIAACATNSPSATADGDEAISDVNQRDGILVRLTIERGRVETGTSLRAVAEVMNLGPDPVTWQSGGCELQGRFVLEGPEIEQPPPGQDWPETAHWAKWSATSGGIGLSGFVPPDAVGDLARGMLCTMELRTEDLAGGTSTRVDATWLAIRSDGAPAPPGRYRAVFNFPFLARTGGGPFQGDPIDDARPIMVALEFEAVGEPFSGIPSTFAIDRAHADPRLQAWISTVTRQELGGAQILLRDGVWVYEIQTMTLGTARISIDPADGRVLEAVIPP